MGVPVPRNIPFTELVPAGELGRGEEAVRQQKIRSEADPENPKEADLLLVSYLYADKIQEAYEFFLKSVAKFPDDWELYIHGREI